VSVRELAAAEPVVLHAFVATRSGLGIATLHSLLKLAEALDNAA
jgi:hypothetical protein